METVVDLYHVVRDRFPEITEVTDRVHVKTWGEPDPVFAYSWFGSLADALNNDMNKGINAKNYMKLFSFFNQTLHDCGPEIRNCIEVSFVENLFWQVPGNKAEPYWVKLPTSLQELYIGFYKRAPL